MKHLSKTMDRSANGRIYVKLLLFILLLTMITNPIASLTGAKTGLLLWFNTVLPTLLPFIILSNLIIRFQVTDYICKVFSPIFTRLFHISNAGCYPLVIGILSGYPMGAKTCNDLLKENQLSSKEGQFLMILGNNASYMFITSFAAVSSLSLSEHKYEVAAIIYLSSIISAMIYRFNSRYSLKRFLSRLFCQRKVIEVSTYSTSLENKSNNVIPTLKSDQVLSFTTVDNCILDGFVVITKIGGYIILFSVIAQISSILLSHFGVIKLLILGLLEITTGIHYISQSSLVSDAKIVLIITITAFGGLSSLAQTKSVIGDYGLSIKTYIKYKFVNCIAAFLLSMLYVLFVLK